MEIANTSSDQSISAQHPELPMMGPQESERFLPSLASATDAAWIQWLDRQQKNSSSLFKLDVTFVSTGTTASADFWLEYFDERVVYKINKALGLRPRKKQAPAGIVNASAREFEFDIKTARYRGVDWRCPAHIHSIVAVPNKFAARMTSTRLEKDLTSLPLVSSVHIDPIPTHDPSGRRTLLRAYCYMRKRKTFRPLP